MRAWGPTSTPQRKVEVRTEPNELEFRQHDNLQTTHDKWQRDLDCQSRDGVEKATVENGDTRQVQVLQVADKGDYTKRAT